MVPVCLPAEVELQEAGAGHSRAAWVAWRGLLVAGGPKASWQVAGEIDCWGCRPAAQEETVLRESSEVGVTDCSEVGMADCLEAEVADCSEPEGLGLMEERSPPRG